jgi:FkbM family methyltransferase
VTGVEADPHIFSLLSRNTAHLDVELVNKAVSNNHNPLTFFSDGADGGRTCHAIDVPKDTVVVQSLTLDDLIDGPVDFLKMDIEGSESSAIAACTKLDQVNAMFIEYHSFKGSDQVLGGLLNTLKEAGFRYYIHKQFCSPAPLTIEALQNGKDLQLNIFAKRVAG